MDFGAVVRYGMDGYPSVQDREKGCTSGLSTPYSKYSVQYGVSNECTKLLVL
jgi:hypothetical protein